MAGYGNLGKTLNAYNNFTQSMIPDSILTNPNAMGGGVAFNNAVNNAKASQIVGNVADKADDVVKSGSKLSAGLDKVGKFAAPVQAATSVIGLGMDIYNTVEANKQMKEQMDLAKKNFNLELEKQQKHELANNQLAASIDKAWGGSGEVAPTIDYSKYANYDMEQNKAGYWENKLGANSLVAGGAGRDENGNPTYMGANSNANARSIDSTQTPNTDNTELGGSGNMPTLSLGGAGGMPVGHSESIDTDNNDYEEGGTEAS